MIGEVSLYGLYVPWILLLSLLALACSHALRRLMARLGLYRLVWHPTLFDFALFIILLGCFTFLVPDHVY